METHNEKIKSRYYCLGENHVTTFDIYYDYRWPFVYRATAWLEKVQDALGDEVQPNWRYFSLNQQNYEGEEDWHIWDEPKSNTNWENEKIAPPLFYFQGSYAAQQQGNEAFRRFHLGLLAARHEEPKQKMYTREEISGVAADAGLDMPQFEKDFHDLAFLDKLAEDHQHSKSIDVFGTPTFVFGDARPVYLKLDRIPTDEESVDFWKVFKETAADRPYVQEMKRP